jgi:outer membrane receptor for ferrienterochelin and colicins
MANIVLKNTKNQPSVPQTVLIVLMVFQNYEITASYTGFKSQTQRITITDTTEIILDFNVRDDTTLDEIVITGT